MSVDLLSSLKKIFAPSSGGKIFTNIDPEIVKTKHFVLHHHLGLGDVICLFGLVKEIQNKYPDHTIHLPVKTYYLDSVNVLYQYLNPNFKIFTIDTSLTDDEDRQVINYAERNHLGILRVGFEQLKHPHHYRMFFQQLDLDYRLSWSNFPDIPEDRESISLYQKLSGNKSYNLIIDANSQGDYKLNILNNDIQNIKLHNVNGARGIFDWITIIKKATTIHSVGTSAFHLIDRVNFINRPLLYFHNVNKDFKTVDTKNEWEVVDYK